MLYMKNLTIITLSHRQTLTETISNLLKDDTRGESHGKFYKVYCSYDNLDTNVLTYLLERIVILDHPVYGKSSKLTDMALELKFTDAHRSNVFQLERYLEENDLLHLEGYTIFRMADYRNKLDIMMYCIIKKLKLTDSLPQY